MKKIVLCSLFVVLCFLLSACGRAKPAAIPAALKTGLTMAVVAEHSSSTDCWVMANNNIYNITDYLPAYPGDGQAIQALCGQDATAELLDAWKNSPNGDADRQTFEQYYIGDLAR